MAFFSLNTFKPLMLVTAASTALLLAACGKPADAPAAAAPAAAPAATAAAPAADTAAAQGAPAGEKKEAEKKDAIDPLAHEGVPGLSDLFSKKKEGGGH